MKTDLKEYLKIYNNAISVETCDNAIKKIEKNFWEQHTFYNSLTKEKNSASGEFEFEMSYSDGEIESQIMKDIWNSLFSYISELSFSWFVGWNGHTQIRFNRYKEKTKMAEHCDHIQSMFDGEKKGIPILSCLAILNDNYSGGELIFWEDTEIKVKQGDILVFPSNFLYPHRVEPVIEGTRYSCVSWAW
jgi:hypothetical protein